MSQTTIALTEPVIELLARYRQDGFKDECDMVGAALWQMREMLETKSLGESADLYAEIYAMDEELQEITAAALDGWPE